MKHLCVWMEMRSGLAGTLLENIFVDEIEQIKAIVL